jgi:hypothetical protein
MKLADTRLQADPLVRSRLSGRGVSRMKPQAALLAGMVATLLGCSGEGAPGTDAAGDRVEGASPPEHQCQPAGPSVQQAASGAYTLTLLPSTRPMLFRLPERLVLAAQSSTGGDKDTASIPLSLELEPAGDFEGEVFTSGSVGECGALKIHWGDGSTGFELNLLPTGATSWLGTAQQYAHQHDGERWKVRLERD